MVFKSKYKHTHLEDLSKCFEIMHQFNVRSNQQKVHVRSKDREVPRFHDDKKGY